MLPASRRAALPSSILASRPAAVAAGGVASRRSARCCSSVLLTMALLRPSAGWVAAGNAATLAGHLRPHAAAGRQRLLRFAPRASASGASGASGTPGAWPPRLARGYASASAAAPAAATAAAAFSGSGLSSEETMASVMAAEAARPATAPIVEVNDEATAHAIVARLLATPADTIHACDTEVADLDLSRSPLGQGRVICISIYSGPDVDFGSGQGTLERESSSFSRFQFSRHVTHWHVRHMHTCMHGHMRHMHTCMCIHIQARHSGWTRATWRCSKRSGPS